MMRMFPIPRKMVLSPRWTRPEIILRIRTNKASSVEVTLRQQLKQSCLKKTKWALRIFSLFCTGSANM